MTKIMYEERFQIWERNRFSPRPAPDPQPTQPSFVQYMPMRDNITLYTEIFLPPSGKKPVDAYPVVLMRSPYPYSCPSYNDRRPIGRYLDEDYAVAFQITRGLGQSKGVYRFLRDDVNDGYDCIEWIANQSWCNGNIGMEGSSYLGSTQLLAARTKPPALKCIMPTAFVGNFTQCVPFSYGVPNKGSYLQWHQLLDAEKPDDLDVSCGDIYALNHPTWGPALHRRPLVDAGNNVLTGDKREAWRETISNPTDNEFWKCVHFTDNELAELDIPTFFTDGWYDLTIGPIDFFTRLEKINPTCADRYLLVGPWNHFQTYTSSQPNENDGERILPSNGAMDMTAQRLRFFDRYLKGIESKEEKIQEDRVKVYITGAKNSTANLWKHFPTFPAPGTYKKFLYLHSQGDARTFPGDGTLSSYPPTNDPVYQSTYQSTDQYLYNPALPTASVVETSSDRRDVEIRSDVLTYTTEPFAEPLTILGEITLVLYAASDATDTDWFAIITEVLPDGRSISFHYAPPAFRARYSEGFDREVFLKPNQPKEFRIPMGPAGHQIAAKNRLRLSVFSAAFPEYEPNSNTGNDAATDVDMRIAQQTIYHDTLRPSHLLIPVIDIC